MILVIFHYPTIIFWLIWWIFLCGHCSEQYRYILLAEIAVNAGFCKVADCGGRNFTISFEEELRSHRSRKPSTSIIPATLYILHIILWIISDVLLFIIIYHLMVVTELLESFPIFVIFILCFVTFQFSFPGKCRI